jgi:hypothetical protein
MSKDFDDILREINKSNRELHHMDNNLSKDIANLKKDLKSINAKIDMVLEILNNFTIMLLDEEEGDDEFEDYDTDQTWVPEEDDWSNHEDDS